jgi:hypothetical protein
MFHFRNDYDSFPMIISELLKIILRTIRAILCLLIG